MRPKLERYEVIGELGQGGMSVVYRARDKQLSRDVAVKVLHEFLAKQTDARRRFHREAVAVAKLRHPGILEIFDYSGPDADQAYIVTELIEGKTLRAFVEEKGRPDLPELGALIVIELVRALRHAHEQGVVHRDLKPENVMITTSGQLKLMDFGIAQIMGGATKLTATGTLLGSPAHMAPEVIDGKPSDHRCDIFSVGTILYWLATGRLPFEAANPSALFKKILEGNYEPAQLLEPRIGNGLARIIDRTLAPSLDDRYADVSDLEQDLLQEIVEVGLDPPAHYVKRFLLDPEGFAKELRPSLIERLTKAGEDALAAGNVGRAMDRFNRVLATDPANEKVRALSTRIGRKERLIRAAKRAVAVASVGTLFGSASYGAVLWMKDRSADAPSPPPQVSMAPPAAPPPIAVVPPPVVPPPVEPPVVSAKTRPKPRPLPIAAMAETKIETLEAPASKVAPKPREAKLEIKIGGGIGDIHVDRDVYRGKLQQVVVLGAGTHQVHMEKPVGQAGVAGRYEPRTIEVGEDGLIYLVENGSRFPNPIEMLIFRAARTREDIDKSPNDFRGWTSY